ITHSWRGSNRRALRMETLQIDGFVYANQLRRISEVSVGKIFSSQTCLPVLGREHGGGNDLFCPKEVHARGVLHLRGRKLLANPIKGGRRAGGCAAVVAMQHTNRFGERADHSN